MQKKISNRILISITSASLAFAGFLTLFIMVLCKYNFAIDGFNYFVANNRNNILSGFFKIFTHLGSFYTLAVLTIVGVILIWFVFKNKRLAIFSGLCFAVTAVANFVIKKIVRRARPLNISIISETGFSFPSGHAMMSFIVFGLLIYFAYKFIKNKPLKIALISLGVVVITLIGFSRIYLGVHYLTDILSGWFMSLFILTLTIMLYNTKILSFNCKNKKDTQ